ncbi:hypothetical protein [Capnocytophaga bilenii]
MINFNFKVIGERVGLRHILGCASSRTFLRLSFAHPSSHTRLCQLADFPSLKL